MKKFILLMGIIIFPLNVKAEEFYTNYHLRETEVENFYEESDLLKREEKHLYNNYYEKRVNEGYYELDKNPIDAPLIDKKDFIYDYAGYYENQVNDKDTVYGIGSMNMDSLNKIRYFKISSRRNCSLIWLRWIFELYVYSYGAINRLFKRL